MLFAAGCQDTPSLCSQPLSAAPLGLTSSAERGGRGGEEGEGEGEEGREGRGRGVGGEEEGK